MLTLPTRKLVLPTRKISTLGEKDQPLTQDQFFHWTSKERSQMDILFISKTWKLIYNLNKINTGPNKRKTSMTKKLSTHGEEKSMSTQKSPLRPQNMHSLNTEPFQTDTHSTLTTSRPLSRAPTMPLKLQELLPWTPKRPLMPGERAQLQTQDQFSHWLKVNQDLSQLITTSILMT